MLPHPGQLTVHHKPQKRPAYDEAFLGFASVAFIPRRSDPPVSFNVLLCAYPKRKTFRKMRVLLESWHPRFPHPGKRWPIDVPDSIRTFVHGLLLEPPADRDGEILAFSMLLDLLIDYCEEFQEWFDLITSPSYLPSGIS